MKSKEKLFGLIVGFGLTSGFLSLKVNEFFTAPQIDVFNVPTVNLDSADFKISGIKGKNLIVNIWATWCAPCVKEMPYLVSLDQHLDQDRWSIVLISDEELNKIRDFREKHQLNLQMLKALAPLKDFGIKGYPTTYVINQDGEVLFRRNGDLKLFKQEFENSLQELGATMASLK
ncbi:MAG: TlpA disulfide reductase family protein [Bacteroidota bacterium]